MEKGSKPKFDPIFDLRRGESVLPDNAVQVYSGDSGCKEEFQCRLANDRGRSGNCYDSAANVSIGQ